MSIETCIAQLKTAVEHQKLDINKKDIAEYAQRLHAINAESGSKAEFLAKATEMGERDFKEFQLKNKVDRTANILQVANDIQTTRQNIEALTQAKAQGKSGIFFKGKDSEIPIEAARMKVQGGAPVQGTDSMGSIADTEQAHREHMGAIAKRALQPVEAVAHAGVIDKETYIALDRINNGLSLQGLSNDAIAYAKAIKVMQDADLKERQTQSVWLEATKDWIVKGSFQRDRIMKAIATPEGLQKFMAAMEKTFGEKSFAGTSLDDRMGKDGIYAGTIEKIKDGTYGTLSDDASKDRWGTGAGSGRSITKSMARSREYIPSSGEALYEFNKDYGPRTLYEATQSTIDRSAKQIGIMTKWGTTPDANVKSYMDGVSRGLSGDQKIAFEAYRPKLMQMYNDTVGKNITPSSSTAADIARGTGLLRNLQYIAKTPLSVFKVASDIPMGASYLNNTLGRGFLRSATELSRQVLHAFVDPTSALEKVDLLNRAHGAEYLANLGSRDTQPGQLAQTAIAAGKWNLHQRWTDAYKAAMGTVIGSHLGELAPMKFSELPPDAQLGIKSFGFTPDAWNVARLGTEQRLGKTVLMPSGVRNLPDVAVENYLRRSGQFEGDGTPTARLMDKARSDLSLKLGAMINAHVDQGSMFPNTRQRQFLYGVDGNSASGQLMRLITQFHMPAFMQMDNFRRTWASGSQPKGDLAGVASLAVNSMAVAAGSLYAKSLLLGKPEDLSSPEFYGKVATASGAPGILGDVLIGGYSGHDSTSRALRMMSGLAGPTISDVTGILSGDETRTLPGLIPGILGATPKVGQLAALASNPVLRPVLDHYVMNELKEWMHSGWKQNQENTAAKQGRPYLHSDPNKVNIWEGQH